MLSGKSPSWYLVSSGVLNCLELSLTMLSLLVFQLGTSLLIVIQEEALVYLEDFGGHSDITLGLWHLVASFLLSFGPSESSLSMLIRN